MKRPKGGGYYYSASQVSTFRDCKRKWAFDKIDKAPRKPNKYAEAGTRIHDKLEHYLEDGVVPDHEKDTDALIMMPGIKYLPDPGVARVEQRFELKLGALGAMVGYIDFEYVGKDGVPVNGDHKTTGDLRYALKGDKEEKRALARGIAIPDGELLRKDTQSVVYAVHTLEKYQTDKVRNQWVYYKRDPKRPGSKLSEAEMHLADVAKLWDDVLVDVKEMKRLRDSGVKAAEVEFNAGACDRYGGCPYRNGPCQLKPQERLRSFVMNQTMKERIKARKNGQAQVKAVAAPEPAPVEAEAPAVNPPESAAPLAALKAKTKANGKAAAVKAVAEPPVEGVFEATIRRIIREELASAQQ